MAGTGRGLPWLTRLPPQACLLSKACRPCSRSWPGSVTTAVRRLVPRTSGELSPLRPCRPPPSPPAPGPLASLPGGEGNGYPHPPAAGSWNPGVGPANSLFSSLAHPSLPHPCLDLPPGSSGSLGTPLPLSVAFLICRMGHITTWSQEEEGLVDRHLVMPRDTVIPLDKE